MDIRREYSENINIKKNIKCFCNICKIQTNHLIIFDLCEKGSEIDEYGVSWKDDYQIIKCINCNSISFRKDGWFSEYCDYSPDGDDGTYEELYPNSKENCREELKYDFLPYSLSDIYPEVIKSYNQKIYILCAAGIRALLEGICKERNIKNGKVSDANGIERTKKDLEGRIYGMFQAHIINIQEFNALHELRFLGNDAIHDLETPSKSDLDNAIDIIEHIIEDIYEIPLKGQKLKNKRESK